MIHHLRAAGTSVVLDARGTAVPGVIHWGGDLGDLSEAQLLALASATTPGVGPSAVDAPLRVGIIPLLADGWSGQQGLEGFHPGHPTRGAHLRLASVSATDAGIVIALVDPELLRVTVELELTAHGVLRARPSVENLSADAYALTAASVLLPLPGHATELLDFAGEWSHERVPQRRDVAVGTWLRESRHGRPGHDDSFLTVAGTPGFGFRHGEVWATHLAWSGDKRVVVDASAIGHTLVGAGELLAPGEIVLATGESWTGPWSLHVHSGSGMDGLSQRLHGYLRSLPSHPSRPRPITLNTWEAVYFDHDLDRLIELARVAADVGVERFVLDDGWMTGRVDASRALGDWTVDPARWPGGLHALVDAVTGLGLEFGLWVEPEMVSLDSELARANPDWVLRDGDSELPLSWRGQQVLDLSNPGAFEHVRASITALLDEYAIGYLKWDMNRDLLGGSVHRQVDALYRLLDAVHASHPAVEVESCSSGGARVDAGILERTQRVWASDTNDPRERQAIQRYTGLLVPPEYVGSHLGTATAHTTGRTSTLSFRLATAFFGHAGIEWDLTATSPTDLDAVRTWSAAHTRHRGLLHSGTTVRGDSPDGARWVHGVIAVDGREAIFAVVQLDTPTRAVPPLVRLPGLDARASYRVTPIELGATAQSNATLLPEWWSNAPIDVVGSVLDSVGLSMPLLHPDEAIVLRVERL